MSATSDKDQVVGALQAEWESIAHLVAGLSPEQLEAPSSLPGWRVRDVLAHVMGTEAALCGEPMPAAEGLAERSHVRNDIGALNEAWVATLAELPPADLLARFDELRERRSEALQAMSADQFDAPSWTPAGQATYGRFMEIRVFDCWLHEQDMRDGLGLPGHEGGPCAEIALDEVSRGLGYVVGKKAGAPAGAVVTFELTGPVTRTIHVEVTDRARLVEAPSGPSTVTLGLNSGLFFRLAGGRVDPAAHAGEISIEGDEALGRRIVEVLAFTI